MNSSCQKQYFPLLNHYSKPSEKIALFRSLFRGRTDVYPQRFESQKSGRAGYSPACANEWVRGVCEKPRIKCSNCPHQKWLPVNDRTVRWHLSGEDSDGKPFVMGVYPMLSDERCYLLAIDLDGKGWRLDAQALSIRQKNSICRSRWNGHAQAMARTFGFSSRKHFLLRWLDVLARTC